MLNNMIIDTSSKEELIPVKDHRSCKTYYSTFQKKDLTTQLVMLKQFQDILEASKVFPCWRLLKNGLDNGKETARMKCRVSSCK